MRSGTTVTVLSFILVFAVLYYTKNVVNLSIPMRMEIKDNNYDPIYKNHKYMCWINPDLGSSVVDVVLKDIPQYCGSIDWGTVTNTYVGHQFLIVDPSVPYDAVIRPQILTARTSLPKIVNLEDDFVYEPLTNFDVAVEWHKLVVLRQQLALTLSCVLFFFAALHQFCYPSSNRDLGDTPTNGKGRSPPTLVPRQLLKAYAVVNMLLNHIGHMFLAKSLTSPWFTILADAGGSLHVFNWLVGYNLATPRSSELWLLGVFIFMQSCIHLPPPVTYETLLSISMIRWILMSKHMRVNAAGRSAWGDAPIWVHALCISAVLVLDIITGAEGLKILSSNGIMSAACGRLFALRDVDKATLYLWLSACVLFTFFNMRYTLRVVYQDHITLQYVFGSVFVVITIAHALAINWRVDSVRIAFSVPATVNTVARFLSTYSLEIYVGHFVLIKAIYALM